jgi:hypothetical protein
LASPAPPQKPKSPALEQKDQDTTKKTTAKKATVVANASEKMLAATGIPRVAEDGLVEIAVPEGAHPGQSVTVRLDGGHVVHAKVPRGLKPGMTFTVPIAKQENHADL